MPTTNARGHVIPAGTETSFNRATIFNTWGNSIRDIPAVANTTERAQLVSALTTAGQAPSSTKPLYVYRADAPGLHRIEYTQDGSVWVPASGTLRFTDDAARDSWTTSNSGLLGVGDLCMSGGVPQEWLGTAWVVGVRERVEVAPAAVLAGTVPPVGAPLIRKRGLITVSTNAGGDVGFTYPGGAFPNGVIFATLMRYDFGTYTGTHEVLNTIQSLSQLNWRVFNSAAPPTPQASITLKYVFEAVGW